MKIIYVVVIVAIILVTLVLQGSEQTVKDTVRVAYFGNVGHLVPIVGFEKGFFEDEIKNKIIKPKLFDSGPQVIESMFARSIDLAYVGPGPAINGFVKSNSTKILAGAASGGVSFVAHKDTNISSLKDLDGKKIASPPIGNTQDISLRYNLKQNNLQIAQFGGSVILYNIANPDIYTLFVKKEIDAAWVTEPLASILVKELDGIRVFQEESLWPDNKFASVVLLGDLDFIKKEPKLTEKWIKVNKDIVEWINNNPDEAKKIFHKFMNNIYGASLSDDVVDEAIKNLIITHEINKESIITFASRADSLGYLGRGGYSLEGLFYEGDV